MAKKPFTHTGNPDASAAPGKVDASTRDAAPAPWWRRRAEFVLAAAVFAATCTLTVCSFPPANAPVCAYVFAVPALLWACLRPRFKVYALATLGSQAVAWTIILGWLHNVTVAGLLLLGPFIGAWVGSWFLAAWWAMPRLPGKSSLVRVLALFGLAAAWVLVEWTRQWALGGFPWLPLAASQWHLMAVLQIAAFTGAGGVSFVLVAMNIGLAACAHQLFGENRRPGLANFSCRPREFLAAMFLLAACLMLLRTSFERPRYAVPLGRFALVQPDIPQTLKWDPASGPGILQVLKTLTLDAAATHPDLILWPEASTPWAVKGDANMRAWVEWLDRSAGAPLLLGSDAIEPGKTADDAHWFNAIFAVDPATGVQPRYYAKRKLVPFGEFVPFRPLLGWLSKVVPIGDGDFDRGTDPAPLLVNVAGRSLAIGTLVCYEDIFPALARESVLAGADILTVQTNTGWFGTGAAAYQHAANSVLRAVETRRPVVRCGNDGWSGWIDEFGRIHAVLTKDAAGRVTADPAAAAQGTIYFRGTQTVEVTADSRWIGKKSFYVEHGDWFVTACAGLAVIGFFLLREKR